MDQKKYKANAYFSGLGSKTYILYDTLIKELSSEEIVAVLAHEIGHYTKTHLVNAICIIIVKSIYVMAS